MERHHHISFFLLTGLLVACLLPPMRGYWDAFVAPKWYAAGTMMLLLSLFLLSHRREIDREGLRRAVCKAALVALSFELAYVAWTFVWQEMSVMAVGACGMFENPGSMAVAVCVLMPPACFVLRGRHRWLRWPLLLFSLVAIVLSKSRAGLLALAVLCAMWAWRRLVGRPAWRMVCVTVIAVAASTFVAFHKTDSTRGRWFIAQRTWEMIRERPLAGYGHGGFLREYMAWQGRHFALHPSDPAARLAGEVRHPLCEFLMAWVDYGVLGCAALVALFVVPLLLLPARSVGRWTLPPLLVFACLSYPFINPLPWLALLYAISEIPAVRWGRIVVVAGVLLFLFSSAEKALQDTGVLQSPYRLYNKAYRSYRMGRFEEARSAALRCGKLCSGYNLELLTGDIERHLNLFPSAVKHYETAFHMCPSRFAPLEGLYHAYEAMGDSANMRRIAHRIARQPIKVMSSAVQEIKRLK